MVRMGQEIQFWRMKRVSEVTGLSKSEIYRRIEAGQFPLPRKYPDSTMNFWPSNVVTGWMMSIMGDSFEELVG